MHKCTLNKQQQLYWLWRAVQDMAAPWVYLVLHKILHLQWLSDRESMCSVTFHECTYVLVTQISQSCLLRKTFPLCNATIFHWWEFHLSSHNIILWFEPQYILIYMLKCLVSVRFFCLFLFKKAFFLLLLFCNDAFNL